MVSLWPWTLTFYLNIYSAHLCPKLQWSGKFGEIPTSGLEDTVSTNLQYMIMHAKRAWKQYAFDQF